MFTLTIKTENAAFCDENGDNVAVQIATEARKQFKDATKVGKGPDVIVGAHDWLGELARPIGWGFAWWGLSLYWLSVVLYGLEARAVLRRTERTTP